MNRRQVLQLTSIAALSQLVVTPEILAAPAASTQSRFNYGNPLGASEMRALETQAAGTGQLMSLPSRAEVVVPIWYDLDNDKFVKSRDVKAVLDNKTYALNASLRGAHITSKMLDGLQNNNLQVHFIVGTPTGTGADDVLTWLAMSGIDVFGDTSAIGSKLISFQQGASLTGAFEPTQTIDVSKGRITMGLELFGHRKKSWWESLLKIGRAIANTPVFGMLGLPMLAKQALSFTTSALSKISDSEKLISLLATPPIVYAVQSGLNAPSDRYKLREGLWVAVDLDTAESTNYLADYTLNLDNLRFDVHKKADNSLLNADYMVVELQFTPK